MNDTGFIDYFGGELEEDKEMKDEMQVESFYKKESYQRRQGNNAIGQKRNLKI
jgi:hypothetical protein